MTPSEFVQRLAALDSCAVSDALDALGRKGCVTGLPPLAAYRRIAGRVHTVRLVAKEQAPAPNGPPRHLGTTAVEAAQAGDIIVIEQRSGLDAGSWGGILSRGAKLRGAAGVIADGPVRDIDEAVELDFPIFARAATARTARGRIAEAGTDIPVTIGDVTVQPGDYVLADRSAVVFVAAAEIAEVLTKAEAIASREAAMARSLHAGTPASEVMGAAYEHMLHAPTGPKNP